MKNKGLIVGGYYFIIHMLVEIVCFDVLYSKFYDAGIVWTIALVYDFLAFVPQGLIGDFFNKHKKDNFGAIGCAVMLAGVLLVEPLPILSLVLIAIGNSIVHEAGAVATIAVSEGKLFPSALFVSGGSFGVVIGQFIKGNRNIRCCLMSIMLALILKCDNYCYDDFKKKVRFDLVDKSKGFNTVVSVALFVVAARSFIGYCIPITWKKSVWQAFLLFFIMGLGKAAGGYLADKFGCKRVAVYSSLLCIPFLVFGKDYMIISIIGVFMFSLTMAITFGMFLSVIDDNPGLAFGLTTLGLFIGTLPVFIFGQFSTLTNVIIVIVLSLISSYGLNATLK